MEAISSYLYYSNMGQSISSTEKIYQVVSTVLGRNVKLVLSKSWALATLSDLGFSKKGIQTMDASSKDFSQIQDWHNKVFMNFTYDELKPFLQHIKYILINYIDNSNIQFCSLPNFEREWKQFSLVRNMAMSDTSKQNTKLQSNAVINNYEYLFNFFLPLNVFMDTNGVLRYKTLDCLFTKTTSSYSRSSKSEMKAADESCRIKNQAIQNLVLKKNDKNNENNIMLQYPFERINALQIIEMKNSLQTLFSNAENFFMINLSSTYEICVTLHKILQEETFAQLHFVNTRSYTMLPIEPLIKADTTTCSHRPSNNIQAIVSTSVIASQRQFLSEFFYFKNSEYSLIRPNCAVDLDFYSYYTRVIEILHKNKKYIFSSGPFDYGIDERIKNNFVGVSFNLALNFTRLKTNVEHLIV